MPLTDEQWALIQPILNPPSSHPSSPWKGEELGLRVNGRPSIDERRVLDGVLWKLRTSSPWYDLPPHFPSWQTCYRRYRHWQRRGVLSAIFAALDKDLRDRCGFNLRASLSDRLIRFEPLGGLAHIHFDPFVQTVLSTDWQRETVYLLLAVLFRVIRQKYPAHHNVRLAFPETLTSPPPS